MIIGKLGITTSKLCIIIGKSGIIMSKLWEKKGLKLKELSWDFKKGISLHLKNYTLGF